SANGVHSLWTPVQHERGKTFVVVFDVGLRPMVTQIDADGKSTTVPLDPGADYAALADGHNRFTINIDPDGYLHISGDMHGYAWWASTYVERYQYQDMMYWRSNKPLDVSSGFTFCGGRGSTTTLPGEEWGGDSRFFNDRNGVLYFSSRVRAFTGGNLTGSEPFIAYGIYRYDHTTGRWATLGGKPGDAAPGTRDQNAVLYWEHTDAFEAYQTAPRFDLRNRLHFAIAGKTAGLDGQGLIYACSEDGGKTWRKADGTPIASLPLRGKDGEPGQGHLVARSPKVAQQSPVSVDRDGRVAVKVENEWRVWSGQAWTPISGEPGVLGSDGMLTAEGGSALVRANAFGEPLQRLDTGFGQVFSLSELGLNQTGAVYAIGLPPGTNFTNAKQMSVLRASFMPLRNPTFAPAVPDAPHIFFSRGDDARVWLSWIFVGGVSSYFVLRGRSNGSAATIIAQEVTSPAEFCDVTAVNGTTYTYQVIALNGVGPSPTSPAVTVTPQRQNPRPPLIQTALARNSHIILRWLPLWPAATSYTVKRADAVGGSYTTIASNVVGMEYTDTGLINDRTYHYVVAAANAASGVSPDSAPFSVAPFRWMPILHYKSIGKDDPGSATASAENPPRESAAQAFDGNRASKWLMSSATGSLDYRFAPGEAWAVTRYRLISGQDAPERDPKDWQFQGSKDGTTWVTLDTRTDQTFVQRNAINTYDLGNTTAYATYRLLITRNNNNGLTQLAELEL
ncbi:MAG TPA: BNR-4 repeat-containing protein, partial [Planctomycetota bacterium]|nr:BNR-4 repeat-containing protein [Planctomycetota bacterium]